MKHQVASLLLAGGVALASASFAQAAEPFMLTSSSFKDGTMLAVKNAGNIKSNPNCVGENVSPPLAWKNAPEGTKSYALLMVDPEGRNGLGVIHWLAYNIPASVTGFAEGETSKPSDKYTGGKGTAGQHIYLGPCTPPGTDVHHYTFTLIATDLEPGALQPGLTHPELIKALEGHAKQSAGLVGLFKKP
ncbi:MAG TPA: YbhB/YbcL family Raf kinase inhibitor-like protein [Vicinamibacterales bacterium]|nr:YbhB/YbcL family Raf kinase inhibitor-like protein [Vicinamibacterales bacterium]